MSAEPPTGSGPLSRSESSVATPPRKASQEDTLPDAWAAVKAEKRDLTEAEKTAFEAARDSTKQLLALATGVIALTITFAKDYIGSGVPGRWLALLSWALFLASTFFGFWALNALTGNAGAVKPTSWLSIRSLNVTLPAVLQVVTFLAALLVTVVYAASATRTYDGVKARAADDSLRLANFRAFTEERLYWTLKDQFAQRGAVVDTSAVPLLRRLASTGSLRIRAEHPLTAQDTTLIHAAADSLARAVVKQASQQSAQATNSGKPAGSPSSRTTIDARILSNVWAFCPLFPFC